jgi:hypothetical protein
LFVIENGDISFNLRDYVVLGSAVVGVYLAAILKWECDNFPDECSWDKTIPVVPTISDIVAKPFIDRLWMFVVTFFCIAVF